MNEFHLILHEVRSLISILTEGYHTQQLQRADVDVASTQTLLWLITGPDSDLTLKSIYLAACLSLSLCITLMSTPAGRIKGPLLPQEKSFTLDLHTQGPLPS